MEESRRVTGAGRVRVDYHRRMIDVFTCPFPSLLFSSSIASLNSHFSSPISPSHHSFISLKSNITQHYLATNMPAVRTRKEKAEFQPYSRTKNQEIKDQEADTNVSPSLTSWDIQLT